MCGLFTDSWDVPPDSDQQRARYRIVGRSRNAPAGNWTRMARRSCSLRCAGSVSR